MPGQFSWALQAPAWESQAQALTSLYSNLNASVQADLTPKPISLSLGSRGRGEEPPRCGMLYPALYHLHNILCEGVVCVGGAGAGV